MYLGLLQISISKFPDMTFKNIIFIILANFNDKHDALFVSLKHLNSKYSELKFIFNRYYWQFDTRSWYNVLFYMNFCRHNALPFYFFKFSAKIGSSSFSPKLIDDSSTYFDLNMGHLKCESPLQPQVFQGLSDDPGIYIYF